MEGPERRCGNSLLVGVGWVYVCNVVGGGSYISVSDSTNLVMLMMMEGPARGLAYAIDTLTILWGSSSNRFGDFLLLLICVKFAQPGT